MWILNSTELIVKLYFNDLRGREKNGIEIKGGRNGKAEVELDEEKGKKRERYISNIQQDPMPRLKSWHTVPLVDENVESASKCLCVFKRKITIYRTPRHEHSALQFVLNTKLGIIKVVQLTLPLLKCIYLLLIIIKFLNFRQLGGNVGILLTH